MAPADQAALLALLETSGFRALFDGIPEALYAYGVDGQFIAANPMTIAAAGRSAEELAQLRFDQVLGDEDRDRIMLEFRAAAKGERRRFRATGTRPNGDLFRAVVTHIPFIHDGEVKAVIGLAVDETALEDAVERQLALEERLQRTLDNISDAMYLVDHDWRFTYVNPRGEALVATPVERLLGGDLWSLFPDQHDSAFALGYRRAMTEQVSVVVRDYFPATERWLEATAYPTPDGIAIYIRDVSEQEWARERLLASEKRLAAQSALLDVATDAIMVRTIDHRIQYWNLAAERLYGYPRETVIGQSVRELLYEDPADFDAAATTTLKDGSWAGEIEQLTASGQRLSISASWTLVRSPDGQPESILTVNTDITARKRQERLLLRTQRMESLGTLAGGIAHDLNNVLAPILMSTQLLEADEMDPKRRELLAAIESGVKRGSDMIRQVLSFARGVEGKHEPVDVAALLAEFVTFCQESLPASVETVTDIADDIWGTLGDDTQLLRVLMNLATNSRDAMPEGGILSIRARNIVFEDHTHSVSQLLLPGRYVRIEVEDSGTGIPLAAQGNIFEPFFTTKGVGEGTGLGLATSITIVRSHGGEMEVYSEPGRGSRFSVDLPAHDASPEDRIGEDRWPTEVRPLGSGELILIVDDEAAIRQVASEVLEAYGYTTVTASNGAEALDIVATSPRAIQLVFTDMMMPVMDGATTAARLLVSHPGLPIIATSGLNANGGSASVGIRSEILPVEAVHHGELLVAVSSALEGNQ